MQNLPKTRINNKVQGVDRYKFGNETEHEFPLFDLGGVQFKTLSFQVVGQLATQND
jgi:hypothetical protein